MNPYLVTALLAYLLGSLPFGYLLVLAFRGEDVRSTGSGNIGATNVSRTSPALGVITLLLDAAKGFAAVALIRFVLYPGSHLLATLAALCAIVGHMFPVWLKFRGGKGVATSLGSFVLLAPKAILVVIGFFLAILLLFRYVSLASIVAVALFPLFAIWLSGYGSQPAAAWMMILAVLLIILKHRDNARRLAAGTEHRFRLGSQ
ncbi:MAG: glycerol-3-phosphate 1-O-acyltransferase PlsY [Acidobacteriales bacterium]|nr:glycerol-3-phosphate 1-O-acyltransferase PlsY [Terriglobales bacterium]